MQLPMFIDGREIWNNIINGDWGSVDVDYDNPDAAALYDEKLDESIDERDGCWGCNSLYECIEHCGINEPVVLRIYGRNGNNTIVHGNGHHRSVVSSDLGLMVPVIWSESGSFANSYLDAQDGCYRFTRS